MASGAGIPFRGASKGKATSYTDFYKNTERTPDDASRTTQRYVNIESGKNNDQSSKDTKRDALRRRLRAMNGSANKEG